MALAELWENWCSPAGEWARSLVIITTNPELGAPQLRSTLDPKCESQQYGLATPATNVCNQGHFRRHMLTAGFTASDPGCAKTRAFNLLVESSSQFGQSENQKCWRRLSEEGNREPCSTLSWRAHVFTRSGPVAEVRKSPWCDALGPAKPPFRCGRVRPDG
jgi:hypothetical protein